MTNLENNTPIDLELRLSLRPLSPPPSLRPLSPPPSLYPPSPSPSLHPPSPPPQLRPPSLSPPPQFTMTPSTLSLQQSSIDPTPSTSPQHVVIPHHSPQAPQSNQRRQRSRPNNTPIEPPYPWSTTRRAVVHELAYLRANRILTITGDVKCNQCKESYNMGYDLVEKFNEIASFIERNRDILHSRAPQSWTKPTLANCMLCMHAKCVEPVIIEDDNERINWLFLLLGRLIGLLKLKHLKYFCTHTKIHQTGAKDRLVFLTYLTLCKQLQPYNRHFYY